MICIHNHTCYYNSTLFNFWNNVSIARNTNLNLMFKNITELNLCKMSHYQEWQDLGEKEKYSLF